MSMRTLPALCLFVLSAAAAAAVEVEIPFESFRLDNGLRVLLHANHEAPVVSTYVLYHVGSKNERPDRTGFAHFFEHLMFEGARHIERGRIDKLVSAAGGNLNASTSHDRTDYYLNLPANELELALWIESERMLHAQIDETGVETQREVVKEERRARYENQPYGSIYENMAKLAFAGTPYEWTPIGSEQYIDQATIEEFRAFYRQWYVPNNAILSIAGAIDLERAERLVRRYFGGIPAGDPPPRPRFAFDLEAPGRTLEVVEPATPLPAAVSVWRAPPLTRPDAYALELLIGILAEGKSSRLYRRLVDVEQAAVNASAFARLYEKAGLVAAFAIGNQGVTLDRLDALVAEEVARLREEGPTEEELTKAINQKETEIASSLGTMARRAAALAHYEQWFGDASMIESELDRYREVTLEDVRRAARVYLAPERRNVLRYPVPGPPPASASK